MFNLDSGSKSDNRKNSRNKIKKAVGVYYVGNGGTVNK